VVVSSGGCHRGRHRAGGFRHRSMIALRRRVRGFDEV